MTVLITGGAGYIGSHMAWKLIDSGEDVVVIDSLSTGFDWAVPGQAELVVGDIGDQNLTEATIERYKIDSVIHFAGSTIVPESVSYPLDYYFNNTVKSRSLIESIVKTGVSNFIFSSTAAVYGSPNGIPVSEDETASPASPYGHSKRMTEIMLEDAAAAHGFSFAVLRYFNVSGADPKMRTGQATRDATHLIKVASETALGLRSFIEVFGTDYPTPDGTCIRDYIHVSDLVEVHFLALKRLRSGAGNLIANCGYGHGYSVLEVISAVQRIVGNDFEVRLSARRPGDVSTVVADVKRAKSELGWEPRYDDLDTIVSHAVRWEEMLRGRNS